MENGHDEYLGRMAALAAQSDDPAERAAMDSQIESARRVVQHADRMSRLPSMEGMAQEELEGIAMMTRNQRRRFLCQAGVPSFSRRKLAARG
jgi:hypothetical protein